MLCSCLGSMTCFTARVHNNNTCCETDINYGVWLKKNSLIWCVNNPVPLVHKQMSCMNLSQCVWCWTCRDVSYKLCLLILLVTIRFFWIGCTMLVVPIIIMVSASKLGLEISGSVYSCSQILDIWFVASLLYLSWALVDAVHLFRWTLKEIDSSLFRAGNPPTFLAM